MSERRVVPHRCCEWFDRALEDGTDNEGYEPLVYFGEADDMDAVGGPGVKIGSGLPPIRLCPWCGATVSQETGDGAGG